MSQFIKDSLKGISLEAIAFQHGRTLLKELSEAVRDVRAKTVSIKEHCAIVENIIKKHTNITIDLSIEDDWSHNAGIHFPGLDPNHPLIQKWSSVIRKENIDWFTRDSMLLTKKKSKLIGWVDLAKGTVHGFFAEVPCQMYMTNLQLMDIEFNTDEEVASVYIHELGHLFTYFELLGQTVVSNFALASLNDALLNTKDVKRRVEILANAKQSLNLNVVPEELAELEESELHVILLDAQIKSLGLATKARGYSFTNAEGLADQFTNRHGGGRAFVTGLDKSNRIYGQDNDRLTTLQRGVAAAGNIVYATAGLIFGISGFALPMLVGWVVLAGIGVSIYENPNETIYDRDTDRFKRIRNDLVVALKNQKLSNDHRKAIINDIKVIDTITKDMVPYYDLWEKISLKLFTSHQRDYNYKQIEQQLEALGSNDLFIKAAEFKTV